jgi:N-acetylgalactosamine-N,N'-diacetylbacillosaminyl-diphospho-undecaprenol 4-alpha-N-acetylgalactosaminyltransferase
MGPHSRLRILFVINSLTGGGAERVFATVVRELSRGPDGFAITVVLLDDAVREAYRMPAGIPIERLGSNGGMLRSISHLMRVVRRVRPDVAVSFLSRANVASLVCMRLAGKPAIVSERVNTTAHLRSSRCAPLRRLLIRSCYRRAQRVIAVSEGVARTLTKDFLVRRERICVIFNPVDIDRIRSLGAEEPSVTVSVNDFVTMGRLVANKNTAMAIRALAVARGNGRLIVLGEGPLRDELARLAASLGLAGRVVFAGFADNPYAILARAGCYLLTSNAEGFPNAMVEAMAAGLPIIATDCPSGPAEILHASLDGRDSVTGQGGVLVRMDDHEAMSKSMDRLGLPGLRDSLAKEARDRVKMYSVARSVENFRDTILKTVAEEGARRP